MSLRAVAVRGGVWLLGVALLLVGAQGIRFRVEQRIAESDGSWELRPLEFPGWIPPDFRGELAGLDHLPETVALRTPRWREELRTRLESNPWVAQVRSLERDGGRIHYELDLVRPVVGVRSEDGFLLVDSSGCVIDGVLGSLLDPCWGIPEYHPGGGPGPHLAAGERLGGEEIRQLLGLVERLARAHIFDRWPGVIREVYAHHGRDVDLFWVLYLEQGTRVEWGRAPGSRLAAAQSTEAKVRNLVETLRYWRDLDGAGVVEIFGDQAVVRVP